VKTRPKRCRRAVACKHTRGKWRITVHMKELEAAINRLARDGSLLELQLNPQEPGTEHGEAERKIIKAVEATGLYVRSLKTERDYPDDATYTVTISHSRGITIDTGDSIVDL